MTDNKRIIASPEIQNAMLKDKSAILVTGASTGIGRAIALHYAKQAHMVVLAGVRRIEDGDDLCASSLNVTPVMLDVTVPEQIAAARQKIGDALGTEIPLAGIINNAGIVVSGPMECVSLDDLRRQYEVNVLGHIAVTQAFLDMLRDSRGRIVNISSIAGRSTLPFVGPYSASKFALNVFSEAFRMELAPWGIHVAIIEPGSIASPIWEKSIAAAEERSACYPAEKFSLYAPYLEKIRESSQKSAARGIPTQAVVDAVDHALFSKKPKTRYLVGNDAKLRAWFSRLPDTLKESLILNKLGIPRG